MATRRGILTCRALDAAMEIISTTHRQETELETGDPVAVQLSTLQIRSLARGLNRRMGEIWDQAYAAGLAAYRLPCDPHEGRGE